MPSKNPQAKLAQNVSRLAALLSHLKREDETSPHKELGFVVNVLVWFSVNLTVIMY